MKPNRPRRGRRPFRRPAPQKFRRPAERIPARLHVILAREAPKAVVFRKGPSNRVCTVGWDLEHDTFTPGQWLKGRIYEYRSDLSPDGELLVYFAADFRRQDTIRAYTEELRAGKFGPAPAAEQALERGLRGDVPDAFDEILERSPEAVMGELRAYEDQMKEIRLAERDKLEEFARSDKASAPSWTAVSRAPYLKALDLWFNGTAWNGGGLFTGNNGLWLNSPSPDKTLQLQARSDLPLQVAEQSPYQPDFGEECPGVYCHRLIRDGWAEKMRTEQSIVYEKPLACGWALQKLFVSGHPGNGFGCYWERHRIVHPARRLKVDGSGWRWADYDAPRNRILYAKNGALYALAVAEDFGTPKMLYNFNDMKFEAVPAPY